MAEGHSVTFFQKRERGENRREHRLSIRWRVLGFEVAEHNYSDALCITDRPLAIFTKIPLDYN